MDDSLTSPARTLVETLRHKGLIRNPRVESALIAVPRNLFLPDVEDVYADESFPVRHDSVDLVTSCTTRPSMLVQMLDLLDLQPGHNVLEIGTGTGYDAAVMQHIVGAEGAVTTIELHADVARQAERTLHQAGYGQVRVVQADGAQGYAPRAAYDRLISTVGVWDIPPTWIQQVKQSGRLLVPIALDGIQVCAAFTQQGDGTLYSDTALTSELVYIQGQAAGPVMQKAVGAGISLFVIADDVDKIDTAALHLLLSDDYETQYLSPPLKSEEYWFGLQLYLMLNEPPGFVFAVYSVLGGKKVYGLDWPGVALFGPGSAAFAPYNKNGLLHCYAASDAFLAFQEVVDAWDAAGRPGLEQLRLRLLPKSHGEPAIEYGKLYVRRDHYLHVWLDDNA